MIYFGRVSASRKRKRRESERHSRSIDRQYFYIIYLPKSQIQCQLGEDEIRIQEKSVVVELGGEARLPPVETWDTRHLRRRRGGGVVSIRNRPGCFYRRPPPPRGVLLVRLHRRSTHPLMPHMTRIREKMFPSCT